MIPDTRIIRWKIVKCVKRLFVKNRGILLSISGVALIVLEEEFEYVSPQAPWAMIALAIIISNMIFLGIFIWIEENP
jgi:hypothetical protein